MIENFDLASYTERTQLKFGSLEDELKVIRRNGFALDREEFCSGMVAIAVPVADGAGRYSAALGCYCPPKGSI